MDNVRNYKITSIDREPSSYLIDNHIILYTDIVAVYEKYFGISDLIIGEYDKNTDIKFYEKTEDEKRIDKALELALYSFESRTEIDVTPQCTNAQMQLRKIYSTIRQDNRDTFNIYKRYFRGMTEATYWNDKTSKWEELFPFIEIDEFPEYFKFGIRFYSDIPYINYMLSHNIRIKYKSSAVDEENITLDFLMKEVILLETVKHLVGGVQNNLLCDMNDYYKQVGIYNSYCNC